MDNLETYMYVVYGCKGQDKKDHRTRRLRWRLKKYLIMAKSGKDSNDESDFRIKYFRRCELLLPCHLHPKRASS